jgi:hypothetical protein
LSISPARKARIKINGKTTCFAIFQNKSVKEVVSNVDNAICGDIDHPIWRRAEGREILACTLTFDFTASQIVHLLPLFGVTDGGSSSYSLGADDTLPPFAMQIDLVGSIHDWANCYVAKYTFRGSRGSAPMQLELDIVGTTETEGSTFVVDPLAANDIFSFTDVSSCTIDAIARQVNSILIQVDNKLILEWNNSTNLTDAVIGARETVIATSVPYTSTWDDLYWNFKTDLDGIPTIIVFASADQTITFTATKCIGIARTGDVVSKNDQIRTPVTLLADRGLSGATRITPLTIALT